MYSYLHVYVYLCAALAMYMLGHLSIAQVSVCVLYVASSYYVAIAFKHG